MNKEDIVKIIHSIKGNVYTVYSDWVRMCAIAIQNAVIISEKRENEYKSIVQKYSDIDLGKMCQAFGMLQMMMEEKYDDYLGSIYMMLETGSKRTGQFFTPYHLSQLLARIVDEERQDEGRTIINEPSCGGGANIIAFLEKEKEKGINYQDCYEVIAQDLDWNCVYMCYVQLSLMGVYGKVIQKDSLSGEEPDKDNVLFTPMYYMKRGGFV